MAKVPTYGGPQLQMANQPVTMGFTDYSSKVIKPDFNFNPALRLAAKFKEEQDNARVDDALYDLKRYMIQQEFGEEGRNDGWRSLREKAVLDRDENGMGLADRVDADARRYGGEIAKKLTPEQQQLFTRKSLGLYNANYDQAMGHAFQQVQEFQKNGIINRIKLSQKASALYADNPGMLGRQVGEIESDVRRLGEFYGWSKEEVRVKTNDETSLAVANALDTLLFQAQKVPAVAEQASGLLKTYAPYMTAESVRKYGELIRAASQGYQIDQVVKRDQERNKNTPETLMASALAGPLTEERIQGLGVKFGTGFISGQESGNRQFKQVPRRGPDGKIQKDDRGNVIYDDEVLMGRYSDGKTPKNPRDICYGKFQVSADAAYEASRALGDNLTRAQVQEKIKHDPAFNERVGIKIITDHIKFYEGDLLKAAGAYNAGRGNVNLAVLMDKENGGDGSGWRKYFGTEEHRARAKKLGYRALPGKDAVGYVNKAASWVQKEFGGVAHGSDGKEISPGDPRYFQALRRTRTRKELEEAALSDGSPVSVEARDNPETREKIINAMAVAQQRDNEDYVLEQTNLLNSGINVLAETRGNLQDPRMIQLLPQMNPRTQTELRSWAYKIQIGDRSGDKELFLHYDVRPTELYNLSREQLDGMRIRLSAEQWDALDTKWLKMHEQEGASQDKASQARVIAANGQSLPEYQTAKIENIKSYLRTSSSKFKDLGEERGGALLSELQKAINIEQTKLQRELTEQERNDFVKSLMACRFDIEGFIFDSQKGLMELKAADSPNHGNLDAFYQLKQYATQRVKSMGIDREATDGEIQEALYHIMISRNPDWFDTMNGKVPEAYAEAIRQSNPGKRFSNALLFKEFLILRMKGINLENREPNYALQGDY
ncbi:transglycosylase SLT domain-containing protein [uncultured Parasutterella sp.]|uniref:transglycosylase SLT domain-containing protein n=1 Tax=uncultured Parasutterella sp. TaxID=1263098 RepID=UPI00272B6468|nr:transglycosylase SLT domain-containing protein [uncultured Parasutterella sp.]